MNEIFGYNTENLKKMTDDLNQQIGVFKQNIEMIYHAICTTLNKSDCWQGESYQSFKNYAMMYKDKNLDPLIQEINRLIRDLENTALQMEANTSKNINLFN